MRKNDDIIAIYSRKSKFTGKGESIGNQVELCKEYVRVHYGDTAVDKVAVYEDEGFSGGNLNRPDFKIMMDAAKKRKFKAIIVYRLDRISRNISDFASLIEELARLDISFVCFKEQFDTSPPMSHLFSLSWSVKPLQNVFVTICTNWQRQVVGLVVQHLQAMLPKQSRVLPLMASLRKPAS